MGDLGTDMRSFVEEAAWASAGVYAHNRTGIIAGQRYNGLPTRCSIDMTEFYIWRRGRGLAGEHGEIPGGTLRTWLRSA